MKTLIMAGASFAATLIGTAATAAPSTQPPMNNFEYAFYTCDNGGAFQISYDSRTPSTAKMTTSNNNKQYTMKRTDDADGVQFTNGSTKFWTDGKSVLVEGTEAPLQNCKLKAG